MWEGIDTSSSSQLKKRSYPMSEPNYHKIKWFSENLLATEINKKNNNEQGGVCRSFTSWHMQYIDVWVLVWLCKTKIWRQCKTVLHRHRKHHSTCQILRCLVRTCRRCWDNIWYIQLWSQWWKNTETVCYVDIKDV